MIEGILAKPGEGKTLYMLRQMHKDRFWAKLFKQEIIQIVNIPVSKEYFPDAIYIDNKDISQLYEWIRQKKYFGAHIYLDEMSILFPASFHKSIPQDIILALRQHRHAGYNMYYTAQNLDEVAKGVRGVTQFCTEISGWSALRFSSYACYSCRNGKVDRKDKYGKGIYIHTNKLYNSYDTHHNVETPEYIDFKRGAQSGDETF